MAKNILVMTSTFPRWKNDTTPSFVYNLSVKLARKYKMIILAPHAKDAKIKEEMENLSVQRFKYFIENQQKVAYGAGILPNVKKSFLAKMQVPFFFLSEIKNASRIIKENSIDLMHAHWMIPQGVIAYLLKKKYKVPYIMTVHGSDLFPLKNKLFLNLQEKVLSNADSITVNSLAAKNEITSRFKHLKKKIGIMPMGTNLKLFSDRKKKGNKIKKILFVGRLNEQKGIEYLLKAFSRVNEKVTSKIIIVGEGEHKNELLKLADHLNIKKYVEFLGSKDQKEISNLYNEADVLVLPAVTTSIGTESFGLVLIEAMACGTPVIGSSSGGIKEIINNNQNGLIFEEKNYNELSSKLIKILTDEKLRLKLIKNGLKFSKNFDWDIVAARFELLYRDLTK